MVAENQSFLDEGAIITPLIGLDLGGEVPRLKSWANLFPNPKDLRGCYVSGYHADTPITIKAEAIP